MDLVKLSITGGFALAATMLLATVAHQGHADPLSPRMEPRRMPRYDNSVASAPIIVTPNATSSPIVRLAGDRPFGVLAPFPATSDLAPRATYSERWNDGPRTWDGYIDEASRRFGVPPEWVRSVMGAESGGRQFQSGRPITSSVGAIGLMQVMPNTYADLRARYGFGDDPYDPRDNVLAGTAYIREMYDRFGAPGFLAAYNAGPGRVDDFLAHGRPLPDETRRYIAAVTPKLTSSASASRGAGVIRVSGDVQDLTSSTLLSDGRAAPRLTPPSPESARLFVASAARPSTDRMQPAPPQSDGLFVALGHTDRRQDAATNDASEN